MKLIEKRFNRIILYTDDEYKISKSILIASNPSPLLKQKGKTTLLFDPKVFTLTQLESNIGKCFSKEKFVALQNSALSGTTVLILKIRKGFLLSNGTSLSKNINIEILMDANDDLYYLIYGFAAFQNVDLDLILDDDRQQNRIKLSEKIDDRNIQTDILTIFNQPPSEYQISYNGICYEIKFGAAGLYTINDQAGIRFIIAVFKRGKIESNELLSFGNKYFAKKVKDDINVIKRARRNKEELISDLQIIEKYNNIPPDYSLSKHIYLSIKITEAGYAIIYAPVSTIEWTFNLPDDFFVF